MIKNIVFDIGNVLAAFRWRDYIKELGFADEAEWQPGGKAWRLAAATTKNALWREVDRGVMPLDDIITAMIATDPEMEDAIRLFFADRRRLVMEYDYSAGWLSELKSRGYKVYLLSNYSQDHYEYISTHFKFFGLEDGRVISWQEKVLKPDARIYNILLDRYGLEASECVFLDDTPENIDGAAAVGMKGIVFKDYAQGRAELEALLGQKRS
ncbi:MAG: HAD family phosphatase [Lachnospiraceae bacterium]|nr:HAD family phosphatase [Lachnospiraceae bacterium]MBO7634457.1 HAD family phosphatase [Lachnospiraceae bacterium]